MKRVWMVVAVLLIAVMAQAMDKGDLDLSSQAVARISRGFVGTSQKSGMIGNTVAEISLLAGGYFTLGTDWGVSDGVGDDKCQVSFGHPYALTSYVTLSVDGVWYTAADFFSGTTGVVTSGGDTVALVMERPGLLRLDFELSLGAGSGSFSLRPTLTNLDTIAHNLAVGIVYDPALGRWGDGYATISGKSVQRDTLYQGLSVPDSLVVWERKNASKGMGVSIGFLGQVPDRLLLGNWIDIYGDPAPNREPGVGLTLYDLTFNMAWSEVAVDSQAFLAREVRFALLAPDFSEFFMRWDMVRSLSMETGVVFPREINSLVAGITLESSAITQVSLIGEGPRAIFPDDIVAVLSLQPEVPDNGPLGFHVRDVFEDQVVTVGVRATSGGEVLDLITRNVFLPATPLSDTGLVVTIDSVITDVAPQLDLFFRTEVAATGIPIFNIATENLFLYENGNRVLGIDIRKDTTGGAGLVDVVFVLDYSGSMAGEIRAVSDNIVAFGQALTDAGHDYRIGIVPFSTELGEVTDLTTDLSAIRARLDWLAANLTGGIENSPEALVEATKLSLRPGSRRTAIWITDEDYPENRYTKEQVVNIMLANGFTVHGVGLNVLQTNWFDPIVIPTGGKFFDINGNFLDILLEVARVDVVTGMVVSFTSGVAPGVTSNIRAELHYAGLGGSDSISVVIPGSSSAKRAALASYPNPFNPTTRLVAQVPNGLHGEISIYNILGQRVRHIALPTSAGSVSIQWDARNDAGQLLASGHYFVRMRLFDGSSRLHSWATQKITFVR